MKYIIAVLTIVALTASTASAKYNGASNYASKPSAAKASPSGIKGFAKSKTKSPRAKASKSAKAYRR